MEHVCGGCLSGHLHAVGLVRTDEELHGACIRYSAVRGVPSLHRMEVELTSLQVLYVLLVRQTGAKEAAGSMTSAAGASEGAGSFAKGARSQESQVSRG